MKSWLTVAFVFVAAVATATPATAQKNLLLPPGDARGFSAPITSKLPDETTTAWTKPPRKRYTYTPLHRDRHLYSPYVIARTYR